MRVVIWDVPIRRRQALLLGGAVLVLSGCGSASSPAASPHASGAGPDWLQDAAISIPIAFGGSADYPTITLDGTIGTNRVALTLTPVPLSTPTVVVCAGSIGPHTLKVSITYDDGNYYQPSWKGPVDADALTVTTTQNDTTGGYAFHGALASTTITGKLEKTPQVAHFWGGYGGGTYDYQVASSNTNDTPSQHITGTVKQPPHSGDTDATLTVQTGAITGSGPIAALSGKVSGPLPALALPIILLSTQIIV